jgi:hypothetical protein
MTWRILDIFKSDDPFKDAFTKAFIPEPDITVFELAEIYSNVAFNEGVVPRGGIYFTPKVWDGLPDNIKRHFKDMP